PSRGHLALDHIVGKVATEKAEAHDPLAAAARRLLESVEPGGRLLTCEFGDPRVPAVSEVDARRLPQYRPGLEVDAADAVRGKDLGVGREVSEVLEHLAQIGGAGLGRRDQAHAVQGA